MINDKTATIIFGYGGAKHIIERHLELWKKLSDTLVFVMPEDDYCTIPDYHTWIHEKSIHYGLGLIKRILFAFKKALELNADIFYFMEYDAILLKHPIISEDRQIQGNVFTSDPNQSFGGYFFKAKSFCHFPYIFTRDSLEKFCSVADSSEFELGFPDRWFSYQLEKNNIPIFDLLKSGEGFSQNTIHTPQPLIEAIKEGRYAIHGIKSDEVFNIIKKYTAM